MGFPAGKQSHIAVFDNVLDKESCRIIIDFAINNSAVLHQGKIYNGVQPLIKNSLDMPIIESHLISTYGSFPSFLRDAEMALAQNLHTAISMYEQEYPEVHVSSSWDDTGFNFQWYRKAIGFYRRHVDSNPLAAQDRILGVVMYLNTVEQGGGTEFPLHEVSVEAIAGRVCIFPAIWTHPHIGMMPISDDKFIISTFLKIGVDQHDHQSDADHHH